jgi:pimeloyl-ACP methyl ester carboxylesterase
VIGGISLGAAVAVNVALRYPDRVLGLVLVRPAWIDRPLPDNVSRYATIGGLIRSLGPRDGLARFRSSPEFLIMERESPDCARSLGAQFEHPRAVECVARLERLAADSPCSDVSAYGRLEMPTLILGNRQDPIHPWPLAGKLAEIIPGALLREVTAKSVSIDRHAADVTRSINVFLAHHFGESR